MYYCISAPGETLTIAEEQAAKEALKNLMKSGRPPFLPSSKVPLKSLDLEKKNPSADLLLKLYSQSDTSAQRATNWQEKEAMIVLSFNVINKIIPSFLIWIQYFRYNNLEGNFMFRFFLLRSGKDRWCNLNFLNIMCMV